MKRLLGLLLVMGMVGCGEKENAGKRVDIRDIWADEQKKQREAPVQTVDISKTVERDGLLYEGDSETPFTGVVVANNRYGQKTSEGGLLP